MSFFKPCQTGEIYHVFNKSIEKFKIFNSAAEYQRVIETMIYYQYTDIDSPYSTFINSAFIQTSGFINGLHAIYKNSPKYVQLIAYCIMPTHFHIIIKQNSDNGIATFLRKWLNSYSRYFNLKHKRKGPLWSHHYKRVHITSDTQLLHETRYVHLNPTTNYLVSSPEEWKYSSFGEYIQPYKGRRRLCEFDEFIGMSPREYRRFVIEHIAEQREMKEIQHALANFGS